MYLHESDFVLLNSKWFAATRPSVYEPDKSKAGRVFMSSDLRSWSESPAPSCFFALSTYDSRLVIVGGKEEGEITNKLWTSADGIKWESSLPTMPTKRIVPSVLSKDNPKCLIVAGGCLEDLRELNVVEVFVKEQWSKVSCLPIWSRFSKATLHDGQVYILTPKDNTVCHCILESLFKCEPESTSPWNQFKSPVDTTALASFGQSLIATGGDMKIHAYSSSSQSWVHVLSLDLYLEHLENYGYIVGFLSTHEFVLHYWYRDEFEKTVKASLVGKSISR